MFSNFCLNNSQLVLERRGHYFTTASHSCLIDDWNCSSVRVLPFKMILFFHSGCFWSKSILYLHSDLCYLFVWKNRMCLHCPVFLKKDVLYFGFWSVTRNPSLSDCWGSCEDRTRDWWVMFFQHPQTALLQVKALISVMWYSHEGFFMPIIQNLVRGHNSLL